MNNRGAAGWAEEGARGAGGRGPAEAGPQDPGQHAGVWRDHGRRQDGRGGGWRGRQAASDVADPYESQYTGSGSSSETNSSVEPNPAYINYFKIISNFGYKTEWKSKI